MRIYLMSDRVDHDACMYGFDGLPGLQQLKYVIGNQIKQHMYKIVAEKKSVTHPEVECELGTSDVWSLLKQPIANL
jgi:hypothetical protein